MKASLTASILQSSASYLFQDLDRTTNLKTLRRLLPVLITLLLWMPGNVVGSMVIHIVSSLKGAIGSMYFRENKNKNNETHIHKNILYYYSNIWYLAIFRFCMCHVNIFTTLKAILLELMKIQQKSHTVPCKVFIPLHFFTFC